MFIRGYVEDNGRFRNDHEKMILSLNDSSDEGANEEDFEMSPYSFNDLLDTPNREDTEKEFPGKKTEVLVKQDLCYLFREGGKK